MSQLNQLTKKNQEFINIATKQLIADGKSDAEIRDILSDALPKILERQATGETARHFLGAPTTWAASFSQPEPVQEAEKPVTNTNPYLMWLDMSLLFVGLIALINILTTLFSKDATPTKLLSLLTLGFVGGWVMYLNYHFVYRHMGKPKEERPVLWKTMLLFSGAMLLWVGASTLTAFLPDAINPTLPPLALALLGSISLAVRYYLKKTYNTQNAMSPLR